MPHLRFVLVLALGALAAAPAAVQAAPTTTAPAASNDPISVTVNMARILRISAPAATVIIGNPIVADVTIQDPQTLVLTGKSYGETNLIVLDSGGNPIADTTISVVQGEADLLTVYMGTARTTLSCKPICQPTITLGDDADFANKQFGTTTTIEANSSK
jgi:Flp pilus assembly secretin CpaC